MALAVVCLVGGSGPAFHAELRRARALFPAADLMAINLTALFVQQLQHIASIHHQAVGPTREMRQHIGYCRWAGHITTHSLKASPGVDRAWPEFTAERFRHGSSSLFGVRVALALGYAQVVLVGIPMDGAGRFLDPPGLPDVCIVPWQQPRHRRYWEQAAAEEFQGRVCSMGGWTAELLGCPA